MNLDFQDRKGKDIDFVWGDSLRVSITWYDFPFSWLANVESSNLARKRDNVVGYVFR